MTGPEMSLTRCGEKHAISAAFISSTFAGKGRGCTVGYCFVADTCSSCDFWNMSLELFCCSPLRTDNYYWDSKLNERLKIFWNPWFTSKLLINYKAYKHKMRCFWIWIAEMLWMEVATAYFKILSQNFPGVTEQNHKISAKTVSPWAEISNFGHPKSGAKEGVTTLEHLASFYGTLQYQYIINDNNWLLYQQWCKGNKKCINILTRKYHKKKATCEISGGSNVKNYITKQNEMCEGSEVCTVNASGLCNMKYLDHLNIYCRMFPYYEFT